MSAGGPVPPSPPLDSLNPLKRPRSESSDDDPEPISYPTPGARFSKDALVCDQCGVGFRKHSDLK